MREGLGVLVPLFSDRIQNGDFVSVVLRTQHGQVKFNGTCTVIRNAGSYLIVKEFDKIKSHNGVVLRTFRITSIDTKSGRHQLEWWGKSG
jgi:hypothetical protein